MWVDDAESDPVSDAIHAWNPRDRVIIRKMEDDLAKKEGRPGESGRIGGILVMPKRCGRYH